MFRERGCLEALLAFDEDVFPNNVVKWIAVAMQTIDPGSPGNPGVSVFKRPLRNTDPQQSIGVFGQLWMPDQDSLETQALGFPAPQQPTIQRYQLGVQAFVKDAEEARGLAVHSVLSQRVRSVLYTNPDLQVVFSQLQANLGEGWVEAMRRWGITVARYFSGDVNGNNLYLTTTELWIETETRRTI
jgi:hypothetical protein